MSHEVETMFYYGAAPWHGLGTRVDSLLTAEEAIAAAKLDWEVFVEPSYVIRDGEPVKVEGRNYITRASDLKILGKCGKIYTPIQNHEAFQFFDAVVGSDKAHYETAGSLRGGERIWLLANLEGNIGVKGEEIRQYLTLTNSHDGYYACQMFFTPVRVVCMNTLNMAMSGAANSFYARHTTNVKDKLGEAQQILGLADRFYDKWQDKADSLASRLVVPGTIPLLVTAAFQTQGATDPDKLYAPTREKMKRIEELFETGRGMDNPAIKGTYWAAYNAVAEWVDYEYQFRKDDSGENRLNNSWFGTGAQVKKRAWDFCLKAVKN